MVKKIQCSLCGEVIPGVYTEEMCWCGRSVSQNPEVFGIEKPKEYKQTERRLKVLDRASLSDNPRTHTKNDGPVELI